MISWRGVTWLTAASSSTCRRSLPVAAAARMSIGQRSTGTVRESWGLSFRPSWEACKNCRQFSRPQLPPAWPTSPNSPKRSAESWGGPPARRSPTTTPIGATRAWTGSRARPWRRSCSTSVPTSSSTGREAHPCCTKSSPHSRVTKLTRTAGPKRCSGSARSVPHRPPARDQWAVRSFHPRQSRSRPLNLTRLSGRRARGLNPAPPKK